VLNHAACDKSLTHSDTDSPRRELNRDSVSVHVSHASLSLSLVDAFALQTKCDSQCERHNKTQQVAAALEKVSGFDIPLLLHVCLI